jgi:pyridinium-3,5-bisthiocarboxylic acid mononucleotide nickel chelatase
LIGFVDCYSGVSGDMLLGAVVDAGVPLATLRTALSGLSVRDEFQLEAEEVRRAGIRAMKIRVVAPPGHHHRPFHEVRAVVRDAGLPAVDRDRALAVLERLAIAEGHIHGAPPDAVELHEVGAIDSIVDVVGTVVGLSLLGIDELYVSSVPISTGSIASSGHRLPAPAPATLAILAEAAIPTRPFGEGRELVTPTGAAILATLGRVGQPAMIVERVGYGAGDADFEWPNVLRLWVGRKTDAGDAARRAPFGDHVVIETNIDDMNPQLLAPVGEALLLAGALDVTVTPLQMKKGRAGVQVSVVARAEDETRLAGILLAETTTLGVRAYAVRRHEAGRSFVEVLTPYGPVVVKQKILGGRVVGATPEFESVRARATEAGAPLGLVHAAAAAAAGLSGDAHDAKEAPEDAESSQDPPATAALPGRIEGPRAAGVVHFDDVEIDLERQLVTRSGELVQMSRTEWRLLECLAVNAGKVVVHAELLTRLRGAESRDDLHYLRVWVNRVRRKLGVEPGEKGAIRTFNGIGYLLDVDSVASTDPGRHSGQAARPTEAQAVRLPDPAGRLPRA